MNLLKKAMEWATTPCGSSEKKQKWCAAIDRMCKVITVIGVVTLITISVITIKALS